MFRPLSSKVDDIAGNLTLSRFLLFTSVFLLYVLVFYIAVLGPAQHDFVCYWSSAKLLVSGSDPYNAQAIWHLERTIGTVRNEPFLMRNPPWVLPLIAPLGFFSLENAAIIWTIIVISISVLALRLNRSPWATWFIMPLLVCLFTGQATIFLLIGSIIFFRFQATKPTMAGLSLVLFAIKPHLLILFWPILLVYCFRKKDFRVFTLAVPVFLLLSIVATYIDPLAWSHYWQMMRGEHIENQYLPNISCVFRMFVAHERPWVQVIPSCAALVWAMGYYLRHRKAWKWDVHGPLLVAVSAFVSPYSWYYDQLLFIPDVAQIASQKKQNISAFASMTIPPLFLFLTQTTWTSPMYAYCAVIWLIWRLANTRQKSESESLLLTGTAA